jgi:hypothetical protein
MSRHKFIVLLFTIGLSFGKIAAQSKDKTYNKRHYNYYKYYYSESARMKQVELDNENKLFCLGNYVDSVKNGHWIYFYSSGKPFASGYYKNGYKIGNWKIYSAEYVRTIKYTKKQMVKDCAYVDKNGKPEITDTIHFHNGMVIKKIGQQNAHMPTRWLD